MDDIDRANALAEAELETCIQRRTRYEGESLPECIECGDPIPERRRQAIRGVRHCVSCAEDQEKRHG